MNNNTKKVGIIAPSMKDHIGGLEFQVGKLLEHLPFEYKFYFNPPENLEKTTFQILKDYETDNVRCFLLFFSWSEAEFWLEVFKKLPQIPILYSERSDPRLVIERWNFEKRACLIDRANLVHFFDEKYRDITTFHGYGAHVPSSERSFYAPNIPFRFLHRKNNLLYVGTVNKYPKRTHWILDIVSRHPDIYLNVCGESSNDILRKYAKYSNIHFHGYMSDRDLLEQYKKADYLVLPSEYEGYPNCVTDASYLGLTTICFEKCLGAVIATNGNCITVPGCDKDILEKTLLRYCGDPLEPYKYILKLWEEKIRSLLDD